MKYLIPFIMFAVAGTTYAFYVEETPTGLVLQTPDNNIYHFDTIGNQVIASKHMVQMVHATGIMAPSSLIAHRKKKHPPSQSSLHHKNLTLSPTHQIQYISPPI
ncbi:MAG: hypothetical protein HZA36_02775 [Parcubacteria group bacterium]|nr:hypothetical protein [Parcubacteria group bacterium]